MPELQYLFFFAVKILGIDDVFDRRRICPVKLIHTFVHKSIDNYRHYHLWLKLLSVKTVDRRCRAKQLSRILVTLAKQHHI